VGGGSSKWRKRDLRPALPNGGGEKGEGANESQRYGGQKRGGVGSWGQLGGGAVGLGSGSK